MDGYPGHRNSYTVIYIYIYMFFSSLFEHVVTVQQYSLNFFRIGLGFICLVVLLSVFPHECTPFIFWTVATAWVQNSWLPVCLFSHVRSTENSEIGE